MSEPNLPPSPPPPQHQNHEHEHQPHIEDTSNIQYVVVPEETAATEEYEEDSPNQNNASGASISGTSNQRSSFTTSTTVAMSPPSSWRHMTTLPATLNCPPDSQQPLTVFAKLSIHPGYETQFEQWYHDITKEQKDHWPGYLSSELLKPISYAQHEYVSIFRYDSYKHLEAWMTSHQRHAMLQRAKEFSKEPPLLSFHSLEYWFVPEGNNNAFDGSNDESVGTSNTTSDGQSGSTTPLPPQAAVRPPAKYKMILVTFLVIWAMNQWTARVVLRIFGKGTLPKIWFQAISTFLTVLVAALIALPVATGLLGFWLFPQQPYTTSLRNGFMSLPWPIPKLITTLMASFSKQERSPTASTHNQDNTVKEEDNAKRSDLKQGTNKNTAAAAASYNNNNNKTRDSNTTHTTKASHGGSSGSINEDMV